MWIVENRGQYISGVFNETKKLNEYLVKTRKVGKDKNQKTYLVSVKKFPLFILEYKKNNENKFFFFESDVLAKKKLSDLKVSGAILYTITENYEPKESGSDLMGSLDHDHLGE